MTTSGLGLDLKGGSQLVLQVQVQDAFKAEADQTIERLKVEMQKDWRAVCGHGPQRSAEAGRCRND